MRKLRLLALVLALLMTLSACVMLPDDVPAVDTDTAKGLSVPADTALPGTENEKTDAPGTEGRDTASDTADTDGEDTSWAPEYGGYYYDVENVVLYLAAYGQLPPNYITKNEARALGWSGGSVEAVKAGAAIGGDRFGNYEGLLPDKPGRVWTECDIDTLGYGSRGSRRLVFSNDGLYFYTGDHYESFREVTVNEGRVSW